MLGQINCGFLDGEHIFLFACMIIIKRLLSCHFLNGLIENQTHGLAGFAVVEGEGLLSGHMEQQIALANAAAHNYLDSIAAASVIFGNANDFLIFGQAAGISATAQIQLQQINGIQRSSVSDGQPGANMSTMVKSPLILNYYQTFSSAG